MSVRNLIDNIVSTFPVTQLTMKGKPDPSDCEDICFVSMENVLLAKEDIPYKPSDNFVKETHDFVHNVVEQLVNDNSIASVNEKVHLVRVVCDEYFERKEGSSIKDAVDLIDFNKESFNGTILRVASKMFEDMELNWGRIVAFLAFSGKLTKKAVQRYPSDAPLLKRQACHAVTSFVVCNLAQWIVNKGGWAQFVKDMRIANEQSSNRRHRTETSVSEFLIGGALCAIPLVFTQLLLNRA